MTELSIQATNLPAPVEILCIDDGSHISFKVKNRVLRNLKNVSYLELTKNIGRAAIRNLLATKAKFDYFLFLDSDSKIISPSFLSKYLTLLPSDAVWMGGRVYETDPPKIPELYLHWYYGSKRESMPVGARQLKPFHHFMTNNFLLPRQVFLATPLDEEVEGYGHEDTLWGFSLETLGFVIKHIDNPVLHLGLEQNTVFLRKQKEAIHNLWDMFHRGKRIESKLLTAFLTLKKYHLITVFRKMICPFERYFVKNLLSLRPNLFIFDLWKLCQLLHNEQN